MYFDLVSRLLGLPLGLLSSLCMVESNHRNVHTPMDGKSASYGICQIKERTARGVDPTVTKSDLMNVEKNIWIAGLHLHELIRKNKSIDKALCQYNTGKPYQNCVYARKVTATWLKSLEVPKNNSNTIYAYSLRRNSDAFLSIGQNARKQRTLLAKAQGAISVRCAGTNSKTVNFNSITFPQSSLSLSLTSVSKSGSGVCSVGPTTSRYFADFVTK